MEQKVGSLLRVKSVNVKEHKEERTTELKSKIDSLPATLKPSNFGISKPQGKEKVGQGKTTQKGEQ